MLPFETACVLLLSKVANKAKLPHNTTHMESCARKHRITAKASKLRVRQQDPPAA